MIKLPSARALQVSMIKGWTEIIIVIDRDGPFWAMSYTAFESTAQGQWAGGTKTRKHHTLTQAKSDARDLWRKFRTRGYQTGYSLTADLPAIVNRCDGCDTPEDRACPKYCPVRQAEELQDAYADQC